MVNRRTLPVYDNNKGTMKTTTGSFKKVTRK